MYSTIFGQNEFAVLKKDKNKMLENYGLIQRELQKKISVTQSLQKKNWFKITIRS